MESVRVLLTLIKGLLVKECVFYDDENDTTLRSLLAGGNKTDHATAKENFANYPKMYSKTPEVVRALNMTPLSHSPRSTVVLVIG